MALRKYEYLEPVHLYDITTRGLVLTAQGTEAATKLVKGFDQAKQVELYWDDENPRIVVVLAKEETKSTFSVKLSATKKQVIPISKLLDFNSIPANKVVTGEQELSLESSVNGVSVPVRLLDITPATTATTKPARAAKGSGAARVKTVSTENANLYTDGTKVPDPKRPGFNLDGTQRRGPKPAALLHDTANKMEDGLRVKEGLKAAGV